MIRNELIASFHEPEYLKLFAEMCYLFVQNLFERWLANLAFKLLRFVNKIPMIYQSSCSSSRFLSIVSCACA